MNRIRCNKRMRGLNVRVIFSLITDVQISLPFSFTSLGIHSLVNLSCLSRLITITIKWIAHQLILSSLFLIVFSSRNPQDIGYFHSFFSSLVVMSISNSPFSNSSLYVCRSQHYIQLFRRTFINDQKSLSILREYEDCHDSAPPARALVR